MAFMVVRFTLRPRLQHGDGAIAHEVIEAADYAGDGALVILG